MTWRSKVIDSVPKVLLQATSWVSTSVGRKRFRTYKYLTKGGEALQLSLDRELSLDERSVYLLNP